MLFAVIFSDSVHNFLCRRSIPLLVWNATDDADSYVRASALHVIGSLTCQSQLWVSLLQTGHVNEVFSYLRLDYTCVARIRISAIIS